jgi:hypothetical protein
MPITSVVQAMFPAVVDDEAIGQDKMPNLEYFSLVAFVHQTGSIERVP